MAAVVGGLRNAQGGEIAKFLDQNIGVGRAMGMPFPQALELT